MPYYEQNKDGQVVPSREIIPEEAIRAIERYDDETIIRSMTSGAAADAFIYRYKISTKTGPKEIIGISSTGSDQLANFMGNIEVQNDVRVDMTSDPDYIYAMLRVKNLERNVTLLGVGRACKFVVGAGDKPIYDRPDEYAFVKSITKAQRNGVLHHASEEIVVKIINTWAKQGKSAQINPPAVETDNRQIAKPIVKPAPATQPAKQVVNSDNEAKITSLRGAIHTRLASELGLNDVTIADLCNRRFGGTPFNKLNESQLNMCSQMIDGAIEAAKKQREQQTVEETATTAEPAVEQGKTPEPPPSQPQPSIPQTVDFISLGFANQGEQNKDRTQYYNLLTHESQLGMTNLEAKEFIGKRGFTSTSLIPKDKITELIKEAAELVNVKNNPTTEQTGQSQMI